VERRHGLIIVDTPKHLYSGIPDFRHTRIMDINKARLWNQRFNNYLHCFKYRKQHFPPHSQSCLVRHSRQLSPILESNFNPNLILLRLLSQPLQHVSNAATPALDLIVGSTEWRMAHLLSQLSLQPNITIALPLLRRAATLASLQVPQPAYVYALLLLS